LAAANTVVRRDGRWVGFNTDPDGAGRLWQSARVDPRGKTVALVGAGGAARAAAAALCAGGVSRLIAINRTRGKADELAALFAAEAADWSALPRVLREADWLLSCLPRGVEAIETEWLRPGLVVIDANYGESRLTANARQRGATAIDGAAWLVGQGEAAYACFVGAPSPAGAMAAAMHAPPARRLALVGFMGAGKTEVGRRLAAALGAPHVELDAEIEAHVGANIATIFARRGEADFRRLESEALRRVDFARSPVLSCGGGLVLAAENRRRLREHATVVWLHVSADVAATRAAGAGRPLLAGPAPREQAAKLLAERRPLYATVADLVVDAEALDAAAAAEMIADEAREVHHA
jgi:shikimate kinase